jgi:HD-GYP domain-containing protein (c-di-GMP phosphodiesterase class II)
VIDSLTQAREATIALFDTPDPATFPGRALEIARAIRVAATLDGDAAIGNIVTSKGTHYPSRHAVNCTALGSLLMTRQEATEEEIDTCLCALLTMNLSMVALQELMYAQQAPLSEEQKLAVAHHHAQTVAMLRERGVTSDLWCAAVQNHHERLDGSGYPKKLAGDAVDRFARVLAVTDQFCALVSERSFREGVNPGAALRHLLVNQGKGLDATLCALLVRELTPYPPGAAVRLQNGEIAIVSRRTRHPEQPIVRALISAEGKRFPEPRKRVTSQAAYHVDKSVPKSELKDIPGADKLWDDAFAAPP